MAQQRYEVTDVRRYVNSGGFIDMDRGEGERWIVPESIGATVELDGYRIEVMTGLDRTVSPTITELRISRDPNGASISELVRGPWNRVLEEIVNRAAVRMVHDPATGAWISEEGVPFASAHAITRRRRSQRDQIEQEITRVIELWPEAQQQRAYIEWLQERMPGLSRRTLQRRVDMALARMQGDR